MFRSVIAVLAGAVVWAVLWAGGNQALMAAFPEIIVPEQRLDHTGMLLTFIVWSVVLSVLAGWVTGRAAARDPVRHAGWLAALQLALGIGFELSYWSLLPVWYHLVFLALLVPATVYGGRLAAGGS